MLSTGALQHADLHGGEPQTPRERDLTDENDAPARSSSSLESYAKSKRGKKRSSLATSAPDESASESTRHNGGNFNAKGRGCTNLTTNCLEASERRAYNRPKIGPKLDRDLVVFHHNGGCSLIEMIHDEEGRVSLQADSEEGRRVLEDVTVLRAILRSTPSPQTIERRRQETRERRSDWSRVVSSLNEAARIEGVNLTEPKVVSKWIENQNHQAVFTCHLEFRVMLPSDRVAQVRATRSLPATNVVQLGNAPLFSASAVPPIPATCGVSDESRSLVARVLERWQIERTKMASFLPTLREIHQRLNHTPHMCAWIVSTPYEEPPEESEWLAREKRLSSMEWTQQQQPPPPATTTDDQTIYDMPDIVTSN